MLYLEWNKCQRYKIQKYIFYKTHLQHLKYNENKFNILAFILVYRTYMGCVGCVHILLNINLFDGPRNAYPASLTRCLCKYLHGNFFIPDFKSGNSRQSDYEVSDKVQN